MRRMRETLSRKGVEVLRFNFNFTNDEARALLPYLRAARANASKDMMKGESVMVHDSSAIAHNALQRIIMPMQKHFEKQAITRHPTRTRRG